MSHAHIAPSATNATRTSLRTWIAHRPLLVFFVLALALSWPFMIVDALGSWGLVPFRLPPFSSPAGVVVHLLLGYAPTFAALIVTAVTEGKGSVRALLRRFLIWRVSLRWYALVLFGWAIPGAIALWLYTLLGGQIAGPPFSSGFVLQQLIVFLVYMLFNGEELGWRGYALPRLQARWSALAASVILAVPWTLLHVPFFFMRGSTFTSIPPLAYLLLTVAVSIIYTWVFNNTYGSVLLAHILHQTGSVWRGIAYPDPTGFATYFWIYTGVMWLAALVVIVLYGSAHLAHKRVVHTPLERGSDMAPHT